MMSRLADRGSKVHQDFSCWVSIFMKNSFIGSEKILAGAQSRRHMPPEG